MQLEVCVLPLRASITGVSKCNVFPTFILLLQAYDYVSQGLDEWLYPWVQKIDLKPLT